MNPNFSNCTKEAIHDLINRAKIGEIDLNEYWKVGDVRYITISKDEIENLKEDVVVVCTLMNITKAGVNQRIIVDSRIWHVPEENRTRVVPLIVKAIREEFGQDRIEYDLMPEYCVNDAKWTSEQNPQLYGSVNFDDIKWNIGKKRTVPDFLDKFGVVQIKERDKNVI